MPLRLKSSSVRIEEFSPVLCYIFFELERFHRFKMAPQPENLVITSVNDGLHKDGSKHYKNQAIDIRSKSFKIEDDKFEFCSRLKAHLGPKFTILYEFPGEVNEHFHIQLKSGEIFP